MTAPGTDFVADEVAAVAVGGPAPARVRATIPLRSRQRSVSGRDALAGHWDSNPELVVFKPERFLVKVARQIQFLRQPLVARVCSERF